ncbi:MAG: hypothetical protein P8K79_02770 [Mariniblastus sp.]|nr:hypothetical protein [Mariniblastus sp.]
MDSRQELATDSLLDEHRAHCPNCCEILDSYQSLEDSFSGKLPTTIQQAIGDQADKPAVISTHRWSGYMPLVLTLVVGLIAGSIIGLSSRSLLEPVAAKNHTEVGPRIEANSILPTSSSDLNAIFNSMNELNYPLTSIDQIIQQFPTVNLYYRYTAELPGIRSSFNVAFDWFQETFILDMDSIDRQNQ